MKKIILTAAAMALSSISAFAAPCVSGQTLLAITSSTCQISNGGYTWDISGFGMNPGNAQNYGSGVNPTASDLIVNFSVVNGNGSIGVNGAPGFAVTVTNNPQATNNFLSATSGQSANWESFFAVNHQGGAAAAIHDVWHQVTGGAATGTGQVSVAKNINIVSGVAQNPNIVANILTASFGQSLNPVQLVLTQNTGLVGIVDTYSIQAANAGGGGTASITSYTNYFFADNPVPEPMTFVLMGAGLVGIAALRRRNG